MQRSKNKARPTVDGLEGRQLLNGSKVQAAATSTATASTPASERQLDYTAPGGARVQIQLEGPGNLVGTTVTDGVLALEYSGTNLNSSIVGTVKGGPGVAPLASITDANLPIGSLTGVGGELIKKVDLPAFDLISGGAINLLAGVDILNLDSIASNSQLHLRDTPLNTANTTGFTGVASSGSSSNTTSSTSSVVASTTGTITSTTSPASGTTTGVTTTNTSGLSNVSGAGTLDPTISGFGGSSVGAVNGPISMIPTVGNGQNSPGTPGLTQAQVSAGRTVSYVTEADGGVALASVGGLFTPGPNLIEPRDISLAGARIEPPGVVVNIKHITGQPSANPPLGDPQIYGFDPVADALIRFDATTGAPLQTIPLSTPASSFGGVALARVGGRQVALVGSGSTVLAFDASTGAPVGGFSTANLLGTVTGIGTANQVTVLADTADRASGTDGTLQAINVAQSLATGKAVALGSSFTPGREFVLSGGLTGVAGTGNLYASGAAHFDTYQPNNVQEGILTVNPGTGKLTESSRAALTSQGASVPGVAANGSIANDPSTALGSLDGSLALDSGVVGGQNVVTLLAPSSLAVQGSFVLDDANPLADLSESFHPELAGSALVDVQGNVQSFTAKNINGLVLNDAGNLNQLTAQSASNSTVIGQPFSHARIGTRSNLAIVASSRLVGDRNGVTIAPTTRQVGPLSLPG